MLLQMALSHSSSQLSNIPLYICTMPSLSISLGDDLFSAVLQMILLVFHIPTICIHCDLSEMFKTLIWSLLLLYLKSGHKRKKNWVDEWGEALALALLFLNKNENSFYTKSKSFLCSLLPTDWKSVSLSWCGNSFVNEAVTWWKVEFPWIPISKMLSLSLF